MKGILIFAAISMISFNVIAQKKIAEGTIKTKSINFSTKKSRHLMEVANQSSKAYIAAANKSSIKLADVKYTKETAVSGVIKKVFSTKRLRELLSE